MYELYTVFDAFVTAQNNIPLVFKLLVLVFFVIVVNIVYSTFIASTTAMPIASMATISTDIMAIAIAI